MVAVEENLTSNTCEDQSLNEASPNRTEESLAAMTLVHNGPASLQRSSASSNGKRAEVPLNFTAKQEPDSQALPPAYQYTDGRMGFPSENRRVGPLLQQSRTLRSTRTDPLEALKEHRVRNTDYMTFFGVGRVFDTLWSEGIGHSAVDKATLPEMRRHLAKSNFGEQVYSSIRRFIVVRQHDRFCTCVPIASYNLNSKKLILANLGLVYAQDRPCPGTIEGISRFTIRIKLAKGAKLTGDPNLVDYAKFYTIETNVKVKDIGLLDEVSKRALRSNVRDTFLADLEEPTTQVPASPRPPSASKNPDGNEQPSTYASPSPEPQQTSATTDGQAATGNSVSDLSQQLPTTRVSSEFSGFSFVAKPLRFFKIGRVFKTLWTEPAGSVPKDPNPNFYTQVNFGELVYSKIRRFVVIREKTHSCLCLPLYTYGHRGTTKSDIRPQDHALVYDSRNGPQPGSAEEILEKEPFAIIVEDASERIDGMSRLNFAQVYTIQHNVKVAKVGRIAKDQLERLNDYFLKSITSS
jgi:hypothetical protein